jgi:hypothetical protein
VSDFKPGDRVIYTRYDKEQRKVVEIPAAYVRSQITSGNQMHVIAVDEDPRHPRQVGKDSIRLA